MMMVIDGNQRVEKKEIVQNLIMEMAIHNNHGDNNTTSNNSDDSKISKGDDNDNKNNSDNGNHNNTSNNSDDNNNSSKGDDNSNSNDNGSNGDYNNQNIAMMSRKEKRKAMKKMKRKQVRKDIAMKEREEEEARLNDPVEQMKLVRLEQEEAERMARERAEFEERERQFLRNLELKKLQEEEEEKQRKLVEESQKDLVNSENAYEEHEDDGWEYVEEGPAEIIWKGNEIIVKKKKVRVPKKDLGIHKDKQERERPISNPLAPQSEVFEDYRNAQDVLETVAQQVPNFGTEQDKEHCPFHLKTGVCRFGARCSRVHFYPDKACTLLLKNMYHGLGLAWEQDEGLEYTEEEAEQSFEDFYEDVHTEFLKFGEIVNFKVCRNASSHLRGNVYVHYKSLDSAVLAYQSINGRYFAGKQLTCEYVNLTRWRVAICGEYMKSRLKTCSRGSACNFIHCFRNPGGDYEWADWDKPAPRYWLKSMAALFGYSGDKFTDEVGWGNHSRRSRSKGLGSPQRKSFSNEDDGLRRQSLWRHRDDDREANSLGEKVQGKKNTPQDYHFLKHKKTDNDGTSDGSTDGQRSFVGLKISSRKRTEPDPTKQGSKSGNGDAISAENEITKRGVSDQCLDRSSKRQKRVTESAHRYYHKKDGKYDKGENTYADKRHDKYHKHKGERFSQEKKQADFSNIDSHHDSSDSEEDKHHRCNKNNLRWMKNDADLSSSASEGSRFCRVQSKHKNRRKSSRLKSKRRIAEIGIDGSLDHCEDRHHRCGDRSSRLMTNTLDSSDDEGRLGRDEKKPRKSSRLKNQSVTDTESDRDNGRCHRNIKKHSRHRKNDADSSDSAFEADRCGRYEKRPQKSRRRSSRSHKESDFAALESNRERIDGEERHHRHRSIAKRYIKELRSSRVDLNSYSCSRDGNRPGEKGEVDDGKFETGVRCRSLHADLDQNHPEQERTDDRGNLCRFSDTEKCYDSSDGGLVSGRDHKRCGEEHKLQIYKTDEEATVSAKVETCFLRTSYQDFDAEEQAELEKACRCAALKQLEEIRKDKDTQAAHSREPVESFRICIPDDIVTKGVDVSTVLEESGSSKVETSAADIKRRRI